MHLLSQERIKRIESEVFIPNLKDPKLIGFMSGNIERIADGSFPHLASVLELGLNKAAELRRRRKGVLLWCSQCGCPGSMSPVPYSSVGSNLFCTTCLNSSNGSRYMHCAGCFSQRTEIYESCKNCWERFV